MLLVAVIAFNSHSFTSFAQNTLINKKDAPHHISKVVVEVLSESEKIHLHFDREYSPSPSLQFETGYLQAILPQTSYDSKIEVQRINNQFIRDIRLQNEGHNTVFELNFANSQYHSQGRVSTSTLGNILTFTVVKGDLKKLQDELPESKAPPFYSENKFLSPQYKSDSNISEDILKMVLALFLILILLYGFLWIFNRYFSTKFNYKKGKHQIKVSSSYHLGPKQKIVILEVNNTAYACGVSPNNITVISEVSKDLDTNFTSYIDATKQEEVDFSQLRRQYLNSKKLKEEQLSIKKRVGKKSFPAELIEKVKTLRPID